MTVVGLVLIAIAAVVAISGGVAWLKGNLGIIGAMFAEFGRHAGEPWTWVAFIEPLWTIPVVFATAALGLAQPDSRWARLFYGETRLKRAHQRHG